MWSHDRLIGGKDALRIRSGSRSCLLRRPWTAMTCFLRRCCVLDLKSGALFSVSRLITGFASALCGTIICWTLPYIFALKVGDLSTFEATSMKALIPVDDRHRDRWRRGHGHGHGQQDRRPEGRALRLFDGLNLAHRFPVYSTLVWVGNYPYPHP